MFLAEMPLGQNSLKDEHDVAGPIADLGLERRRTLRVSWFLCMSLNPACTSGGE